MTTQTTHPAAEPAWWTAYKTSFTSAEAHALILHGDIAGYAQGGISQRRYLQTALAQTREIVAVYHRATGITFPVPSMLEKARTLLEGAIAPQPSAKRSATTALTATFASIGPQPTVAGDPFAATRQPTAAVAVLDQLLTADVGRGKVAVIIDLADLLLPPFAKATASPENLTLLAQMLAWSLSSVLSKSNNPLFLLTARLTDLHEDVRASGSGWRAIALALPDLAARTAYLTWYGAKRDVTYGDLDADELARLTAGLNLRHIEDILLLAMQAGAVTRQLVKARKDQIITSEYSEVAEMIEPLPGGFTALGGMEHLMAWAQTDLIAPVREGRPQDAPKGVLLVGPPGTGKTFFTRALAAEVRYNAVALNFANILGGIVGESERKLQRFFTFVRALAPVLVFIDELDQTDVSRRGNGSGNPVAVNLFNAMLQFLSDETLRGQVMVLFATNRPDLIDPALLRFGRMDAIIPVLLPDSEARRGIITAQARMQGVRIDEEAVSVLAEATEDYSAADLAAVVAKARKLARRAGGAAITVAAAQEALTLIRPATPQQAQWYTLQAIGACTDAELLPPRYRALLADRTRLASQIREVEPEQTRSGRTL